MRKFDYSFLKRISVPADIMNSATSICELEGQENYQETANRGVGNGQSAAGFQARDMRKTARHQRHDRRGGACKAAEIGQNRENREWTGDGVPQLPLNERHRLGDCLPDNLLWVYE